MPLPKDILAYHAALPPVQRRICAALVRIIEKCLPHDGEHGALERKVWHRHPVWFLDQNPIVGYAQVGGSIRLMFWSGQSFDEAGLPAEPAGTKFKSAAVRFAEEGDIDVKDLKRWLAKSVAIQWDYKNIVKRKGRLVRLK